MVRPETELNALRESRGQLVLRTRCALRIEGISASYPLGALSVYETGLEIGVVRLAWIPATTIVSVEVKRPIIFKWLYLTRETIDGLDEIRIWTFDIQRLASSLRRLARAS